MKDTDKFTHLALAITHVAHACNCIMEGKALHEVAQEELKAALSLTEEIEAEVEAEELLGPK